MNRTFSLNNVSDIGSNNTNGQAGGGQHQAILAGNDLPINGKNLVVPLTQATINAFNTNSARFNYSSNNNSSQRNLNLNDNSTEESMSQLNYSCKLQSKYASSNYLNDFNSMQQKQQLHQQQQQQQQQQQLKQSQQQLPQRTRTTPRRRTPRNAEEFLMAAGVTDTQSFLNKGYYVGSMLNLHELGNSTSRSNNQMNQQHQQQQMQCFDQNGASAAVASSSSSSASGFNGSNKPNNNNIVFKEQNLDLQMKRRNSIHDTTSVSMANLNFLNNNFSPNNHNNNMNSNQTSSKAPTQSYFRSNGANGNSYSKARSHTTAIISLNDNIDENYTQNSNNIMNTAGSTSNGSSALPSDSSSSPTPNGVSHQMKQQTKLTLGPLMSAVSKLENVSLNSPSNGTTNLLTFHQQHLNEDDYDDYEYLERNLGAEPSNNISSLKNNNQTTTTNTTTNTNVTDYYTDESNSCNNEDFNQFNNLCKLNKVINAENMAFLNEQSPVSINNSNTTIASPYNNNNNNNNNIQSNNNYYYSNNISNKQMNIHQIQAANNNLNSNSNNNTQTMNNGWDHASMISNNTVFSGWFTIELTLIVKNRILFYYFKYLSLCLYFPPSHFVSLSLLVDAF